MLFVEIFAFVKVVGEFELKTLANLVIILNRDASYVRAPHARASREREAFSHACFVALKSFAIEKPPVNTTTFWAAYAQTYTFPQSLYELKAQLGQKLAHAQTFDRGVEFIGMSAKPGGAGGGDDEGNF